MKKYPNFIRTEYGVFRKSLHIKGYIYYMNDEGDVMVYKTPEFKLLSSNIHAQNDFIDELVKRIPTKNWIWISPLVKKHSKDYMRDYGDDIWQVHGFSEDYDELVNAKRDLDESGIYNQTKIKPFKNGWKLLWK